MRAENKDNARIRIKDADEFIASSRENLDRGRFKASLDHSVDATIAANDAFTIYYIEQVASADHMEAIKHNLSLAQMCPVELRSTWASQAGWPENK